MELDTAMELSFWKEEPLSPFGLAEEEADLWELFGDVKQDGQADQDPLEDSEKQGAWLPESPSDSCDSLSPSTSISARAQLASQLLEDLDEVLIKQESFSDWYESKTDLPMFEELPSPTPPLCKEDALAGAASRPFAGLSLTPQFAPIVAVPVAVPAFAPAAPSAVHVPLSALQQPPAAGSLQPLEQPAPAIGLLTTAHLHLFDQQQQQQQQHQLSDTVSLLQELQEFESVYGKVEQSHGGALTPPQSPPQSPPHHIHHRQPVNTNGVTFAYQPQQQQPQLPQLPQLPPQSEYNINLLVTIPQQQQHQQQQQLLDLDEIVRSRVQAEEAWPSPSPAFAPPSPCTSSNSSCSFTSEELAPGSPESDDPDWAPDASPEDAAPASNKAPGKAAGPSRSKRGGGRRKPYGANVEDKRQRKKEQNKNAATRYRMKKKAEVEVIVGEENELKEKNDELQAKVADLSQEIRYLKNLMRDLFRARGLIK